MKVIVRQSAEDDLDRLFTWIEKRNHIAAIKMVSRIRDEYPYIIVYKVDEDQKEVVVISIVHGAQDRHNQEHER
jgi:plasmid stabilization system protein ParE